MVADFMRKFIIYNTEKRTLYRNSLYVYTFYRSSCIILPTEDCTQIIPFSNWPTIINCIYILFYDFWENKIKFVVSLTRWQ